MNENTHIYAQTQRFSEQNITRNDRTFYINIQRIFTIAKNHKELHTVTHPRRAMALTIHRFAPFLWRFLADLTRQIP